MKHVLTIIIDGLLVLSAFGQSRPSMADIAAQLMTKASSLSEYP